MAINKYILAAIVPMLLGSCSLDIDEAINLKKGNFFFSTEKYFEIEQERLRDKKGFTKFVDFNGEKETMKLDTLNLEQEFVPFMNTDINKVIWSDQYECDTLFQNQNLKSILCSTSNLSLKTRSLEVQYKNGEVESIEVECMMNKMLLQTSEYLSYHKDDYYQIRRIQMLKTGKCDSTLVKVTF